MGRLSLAFRAFFGVLSGSLAAERMQQLLEARSQQDAVPEPTAPKPAPAAPAAPPAPRRSEAVTLLAALQREARLVDLIQEPLHQYSDQQIGAAARDVLRDCHQVLERLFALKPVVDAEETEELTTPEKFSSQRWRVSGKVVGEPPFRGRLMHHGWEATRCELPQWAGDTSDALIVAPAEIDCN
jgi:hypothetical protein